MSPPNRVALLTALAAGFAVAQTPAPPPKQFDVATVKPNSASDRRVMLQITPGGRFVSTGTTLKMLMTEAYSVRDFQIFGGPGWINTDRWDINAKAEDVTGQLPIEEFKPMLRALIEDRFQLKVHREMKEMPAYILSVGKGELKLQTNSGEPGPMLRMGRGELTGKKVQMPMFLQALSQQLGRPVIDKTGLTGEYDFTLQWTPEPGSGGPGGGPPGDAPVGGGAPGPAPLQGGAPDGPSVFTAIQEQLGLRLDSQKVTVETVVIERVEKPSEN